LASMKALPSRPLLSLGLLACCCAVTQLPVRSKLPNGRQRRSLSTKSFTRTRILLSAPGQVFLGRALFLSPPLISTPPVPFALRLSRLLATHHLPVSAKGPRPMPARCPLRPADAPLALRLRRLLARHHLLVSAKGAGPSYTQFLVDEYTASHNNAGLSTSPAANHGSTSCAGISLRCMSTWTTQELRKRGIGKRKQARMVADGTLHRVHRGIYISGRASAHNIAR